MYIGPSQLTGPSNRIIKVIAVEPPSIEHTQLQFALGPLPKDHRHFLDWTGNFKKKVRKEIARGKYTLSYAKHTSLVMH
jgi:hypothetical protein